MGSLGSPNLGLLSPTNRVRLNLVHRNAAIADSKYPAHFELSVHRRQSTWLHRSPHWPSTGSAQLQSSRTVWTKLPKLSELGIHVCCALHFIIYLFEINFYFFCSFFPVPTRFSSNRNLITLEISEAAATASLGAEAIEAIRRSEANR